ncbi:MAG: ComF family protein [Mangrovibacterium sp.]
MKFNSSFKHFIDLIVPRHCLCCRRKLLLEEKYVCLHCMLELPHSQDWLNRENSLKTRLEELIPVEYAVSLLAYNSESRFRKILHALKYENQPQIGNYFGEMLGRHVLMNPDLASADYICPIPLHTKKLKDRGYNQSAHLAQGVANTSGIIFNDNNLVRTKNTSTQTKKSASERKVNVKNVFQCVNPSLFQDKHIILIDDVITTGATIESCTYAVLPNCNARISVLCLARMI